MSNQLTRVLVPLGTDKNDGNVGEGEAHFARKNYLERLFEVGLLPILISPFTPVQEASRLLRECSGLLLMGGDDVDATRYGEQNHERNVLVIPERDELEFRLIAQSLDERVPILGICRGFQAMVVATGGSLVQHLPDEGSNVSHSGESFVTYDQWLNAATHPIHITPNSRTASLLDVADDSVITNSAHHQAVKTLREPWKSGAIAEDGTIEIIEHSDADYFAFGIQSHPEVFRDGPLQPFFCEFASACAGS